MALELTTEQVWQAINRELFGVLGMVTAHNEPRTVGIVYAVRDHKLYVGSDRETWKCRHIEANPHVSMTVTIAKQIPFMPWIRIPAATITFQGTARVLAPADAPAGILDELFRGLALDETMTADLCVIEIVPQGDFLTYGVGISMIQMRNPQKAIGRAHVNGNGNGHGPK
jgi:hypothetical protein